VLRMLLRVVLTILFLRFVGGLFRAIAGGSQPDRQDPPAPRPPRSLVDRASAIDVPFTEERQEG